MNHNDTVKQSFKNQAEKFAAYHMSKTEYTDYLMKRTFVFKQVMQKNFHTNRKLLIW